MRENLNKDPWYHTPNTWRKLAYLSIAVTGVCNLDCTFCYVNGSKKGFICFEKLKQILEEGMDLGLQKAQISGGEPFLYQFLKELISFLYKKEIQIMIVTNGTLIDEEWAKFLSEHKVIVGISMESLDDEIESKLNGRKNVLKRKIKSIEFLKKYNYTQDIPLYIITKPLMSNIKEIPKLWQWAVNMGVQPILDRAIPNPRLPLEELPPPKEIFSLLTFLHRLIECEQPYIPFVCNEGCNRLRDSLHIEYNGDVLPCGGMKLVLGNVFRESLTQILNKEIVEKIRNVNSNLKESCGRCKFKNICYGCRGIAYEIFGDIYAPDPYCWNYNGDGYDLKLNWIERKLINKQGEIEEPWYLKRLKLMTNIPKYMGRKDKGKS